MTLLVLKILVTIGGASFFALGIRLLWQGAAIAGSNGVIPDAADSHIRYLGVVSLGYAFLMWQNIPSIATPTSVFYLLIAVIFTGGLVRLLTMVRRGVFNREVTFAMVPELVLPPIVFLLQKAVSTSQIH